MARTTLEMLGQAGLGYSFDDFFHDSNDEYAESIKLFLYVSSLPGRRRRRRELTVRCYSPTFQRMLLVNFLTEQLTVVLSDHHIRALLRWFPGANTRNMVRIRETLDRRSREIIAEKKAALAKGDAALTHEVGEGKDIMSICRASNT